MIFYLSLNSIHSIKSYDSPPQWFNHGKNLVHFGLESGNRKPTLVPQIQRTSFYRSLKPSSIIRSSDPHCHFCSSYLTSIISNERTNEDSKKGLNTNRSSLPQKRIKSNFDNYDIGTKFHQISSFKNFRTPKPFIADSIARPWGKSYNKDIFLKNQDEDDKNIPKLNSLKDRDGGKPICLYFLISKISNYLNIVHW